VDGTKKSLYWKYPICKKMLIKSNKIDKYLCLFSSTYFGTNLIDMRPKFKLQYDKILNIGELK
jgi:hypothetical protein